MGQTDLVRNKSTDRRSARCLFPFTSLFPSWRVREVRATTQRSVFTRSPTTCTAASPRLLVRLALHSSLSVLRDMHWRRRASGCIHTGSMTREYFSEPLFVWANGGRVSNKILDPALSLQAESSYCNVVTIYADLSRRVFFCPPPSGRHYNASTERYAHPHPRP